MPMLPSYGLSFRLHGAANLTGRRLPHRRPFLRQWPVGSTKPCPLGGYGSLMAYPMRRRAAGLGIVGTGLA